MTGLTDLRVVASAGGRDALRAAAQERLEAGAPREQVLAELDAIRPGLSDGDEDAVLDVLDFVAGWCSPRARL